MPDEDQTRILRGRPTPVGPPPVAEPASADAPDEATRILSAREASRLTERPPAKSGDKIVFACPNGHRIVARSQDAGKRGKCSKCDVDVQIPGAAVGPVAAPPPPPAPESAAATDEPGAPPAVVVQRPVVSVPPPPAAAEGEAGEAGGDAEPGAAAEPTVSWDFMAAGPEAGGGEESLPALGEEPIPALGEDALEVADWPAIDPGGLFDDEGANPTAHLVARLWAERQHGGVIELHLAGGSVILPSYFDPAWSRGTHGLFGKEELDGSYTLTAIAWGTVEKVIVRQLTAVPPDMFP
jgi:hypothetical protein